MSGNSFGRSFVVSTFGESHGPALGCVVDGCPPGLPLTEDDLQSDIEQHLAEQARRLGLSLPDYIKQIVSREAQRSESIEQDAPPTRPVPGNLHEFFMNSPLRGASLDLERARDYPRAFEIE